MTLAERMEGGLIGLLAGDALGVPYEFNRPEDLPAADAIEMTPPAGFERSHAGVPPGTWSDDGAQALLLLESLLERNGFDPDDFGQRLVSWYNQGYMAVDSRVFDCGITTATAIRRMLGGTPPLEAGPAEPYDNGNGSLMRALPLALWHSGSDQELVRDARLQSRVTHGHLRSQLCCALYVLWGRRIMQEHAEPWEDAVRTLRDICAAEPEAVEELEWSIRPDLPPEGNGSGYVVDSLRSARLAVSEPNYEMAMKRAIGLGQDTDTTACIAGGIVGLRDGLAAIPERWRTALRGRELLDPLLHRLLEVVRGRNASPYQ